MVETLGEDYIRTATAKGVKKRKVIFRHALRAAIVPGDHDLRPRLRLPAGRHGLHREDLRHRRHRAVGASTRCGRPWTSRWSPATVLVGAVIIVVANLIVDILYSVIDPRVRLS